MWWASFSDRSGPRDRPAISWSAGEFGLFTNTRSAPNLQSLTHNLFSFDVSTGAVRDIDDGNVWLKSFDSRLTLFSLFPIDALHGQWHDGQRYYPGCSWLSPWSSPWGSCWCSPQGLEAMGNSRRRTNGSPRSASPSIVRSLGKKVSVRASETWWQFAGCREYLDYWDASSSTRFNRHIFRKRLQILWFFKRRKLQLIAKIVMRRIKTLDSYRKNVTEKI